MGKKVSFNMTGQSLENLKSEGVPDDVLEKLESIKNQEVTGEEEFVGILKTTIGEQQTVRFKSLFSKHAVKNNKKDSSRITVLLKRASAVIAITGTILAGVAVFSGHLSTIVKNFKSIFADISFLTNNKTIRFELISEVPEFALLGTVSGTALVEPPFLKLSVKQSTLRAPKESQLADGEKIENVRIGLASYIDQSGAWDVAIWSEKIPIGISMQPNETKQIPSFNSLIPIDEINDLSNYWLVLEIEIVDSDGEIGTTYAHSVTNLFNP